MSASVKLSLKAARWLRDHFNGIHGVEVDRFKRELGGAIAKATRASATLRELRKPKAAKRATKREETAVLRAELLKRAGGHCEACEAWCATLEMDHFWGRVRRTQSVENCWMLCKYCHREKTDNTPTATRWLTRFVQHAWAHHYLVERAEALKRIGFLQARGTP